MQAGYEPYDDSGSDAQIYEEARFYWLNFFNTSRVYKLLYLTQQCLILLQLLKKVNISLIMLKSVLRVYNYVVVLVLLRKVVLCMRSVKRNELLRKLMQVEKP